MDEKLQAQVQSHAEALALIFGQLSEIRTTCVAEIMALKVLLAALVSSHPDPASLRDEIASLSSLEATARAASWMKDEPTGPVFQEKLNDLVAAMLGLLPPLD
jgi:hypothetical protein